MLLFIGPIVLGLFAAFLSLALPPCRGEWDIATGWFFGMAALGLIIFGVAVPGFATGSSEELGERSVYHIREDTIDVSLDSSDSVKVNVRFTTDENGVMELTADGDNEFIVEPSSPATITHICDETPDWAAPYTLGDCWDRVTTPEKLELTIPVE